MTEVNKVEGKIQDNKTAENCGHQQNVTLTAFYKEWNRSEWDPYGFPLSSYLYRRPVWKLIKALWHEPYLDW